MNIFSSFAEYDKPQESLYAGPQGFFGNYCGSNKINSLGPEKSIETNISKESIFRMTKAFGPFFLVLSTVPKLKKDKIGVHKPI